MASTLDSPPQAAQHYRLPELLQDIRLLDLLELCGSTVHASAVLSLSQPTVSRRYRALAADFNLERDLRRRGDCCFGSSATLRLLRLGCRAHRLACGVARISGDLLHQPLLAGLDWLLPSPLRFRCVESWLELVRHRGVAPGLQEALRGLGMNLKSASHRRTTPQSWLDRLQSHQLAIAVSMAVLESNGWGEGLQRLDLPEPLTSPVLLALPKRFCESAVLEHTAHQLGPRRRFMHLVHRDAKARAICGAIAAKTNQQASNWTKTGLLPRDARGRARPRCCVRIQRGVGQEANTALQEGLENPGEKNTVAQSCIPRGHRTVRLRSHHNVKGSQRR
jgi:hypothetical protein